MIALMETKQLEKEGYRVIHVPDGIQAIEIVHEKRDLIDLILMDIDLGPGIDGTQAAKEILKHHDIPIVFLSARVEKEVVQKARKNAHRKRRNGKTHLNVVEGQKCFGKQIRHR